MPRLLTTALVFLLAVPAFGQAEEVEVLFYTRDREDAFQSFAAHVEQIDVVGPQVYQVREDGVVWGEIDPRLLDLARRHDVKVMPLIRQPGFDQETFHQLMHDSEARARTVAALVDLAREHDFWGWQFDFENIRLADRDAFTTFYREAADALHADGRTLSVAVVPFDGRTAATAYQRFMQANWRGAFDLAALAEIGDFISLMTYDQHTRRTPPGPIAGLPWVRGMLDHALAEGVPPEKLSLGIPTYSGYWYATHDDTRGLHASGRPTDYATTHGLIERHGAEPVWDPEQGASWAVWNNRGTFEYVFLEDRRAFEAKLDLLDEYPGLRGISVWVLGLEDPAIWDALDAHPSINR